MAVLAILALGVSTSQAVAETPPPEVDATWATSVASTSANLRGEINPAGFATSYRFEYIAEDAFLEKGFSAADRVPTGNEAFIGSSGLPIAVVQHLGGLQPDTAYRYRLVATNTGGVTPGPARPLTTRESAPSLSLPENRAWEMVSLVDKNGGEIQGFGGILGGAVIQAAEQGSAITYSSASAFDDPKGAPGGSQYVSTRTPSSWDTDNVTLPMLSGSFPEALDSGVPYQLFSTDLSSGLVSNGRRCLSSATNHCPVENAPVPGSGAPAGYRNYYLRSGATGTYTALLSSCGRGRTGARARPLRTGLRRRHPGPRPHRPLELRGAHRGRDRSRGHAKANAIRPSRTSTRSPAPTWNWSTMRPAPASPPRAGRSPPTARASTGATGRASTCATAPPTSRSTRPPGEGGPSRPPASTARSPSSARKGTCGATCSPTKRPQT